MSKRSAEFLAAMAAYDRNDGELALRLMEDCARNGDPVACYMAALWRRNRQDSSADKKRSEEWMARLEQLAEQGNGEAQWEFGQLYRFGDLIQSDIDKANFWLERAAENGFADAQHHLAWFFETGQYGYPVDSKAAEKWYHRALEQQHPETLYLFAVKQFREGRPTEEAIELLRRAADLGFAQAAEILRSYTH